VKDVLKSATLRDDSSDGNVAFGSRVLTLALVCTALACSVAHASEAPEDATDPASVEAESDSAFRFEHHGYLRFRADMFYNGHLGAPSTAAGAASQATRLGDGIPTRSSASARATDEDVLTGANMRFRYMPTVHLQKNLRVGATLDILDNLVLGSTPDFLSGINRASLPLLSESQHSPDTSIYQTADAIRVKECFAEWRPLFLLRVGRQANHWGLGILSNNGHALDADEGDISDQVLVGMNAWGLSFSAAYDFVFSGAVTEDPADNFGQASDVGTTDDIQQARIAISSTPDSPDAIKARLARLAAHEPVLDWGIYALYRHQAFAGGDETSPPARIDAWAVVPDLWARYEQQLDDTSRIRVELELVGVFGQAGPAPGTDGGDRELQQVGGALEVEYTWRGLSAGGLLGGASGSDTSSGGARVTAFRFDRDYHVDLLLFREVIGTVSNAVYARPFIAYDLFADPRSTLGIRLDVLSAYGLTNGEGRDAGFLGSEIDLGFIYDDGETLSTVLEAGLLIPGDALQSAATLEGSGLGSALAFTLQWRIAARF